MHDFLVAEGFRVQTARNAFAASILLERSPVDCVLLDIMMPGEDGFDLARRIRESNEVPILFLSARDGDVDKIRGLGLGGDAYIVKSASPGVVARVRAVLRHQRNGSGQQHAAVLVLYWFRVSEGTKKAERFRQTCGKVRLGTPGQNTASERWIHGAAHLLARFGWTILTW